MALKAALNDKEQNKFVEDANGETAIRTVSIVAGSDDLYGIQYDAKTYSYSGVQTIITYLTGGISGTAVATRTKNYPNTKRMEDEIINDFITRI